MTPRTRHMTPPRVDPRRPGLVWPVAIDSAGVTGPTRAQARGSRWTQATHGLYLPADLDPALATDQRIVTAAALLPPGGAITGWAALRWAGARYLDGTRRRTSLAVTLAVPPGTVGPRDGIEVTAERQLRTGLVERDGLTLSSPAAATSWAVRHAPTLAEAVGIIDRVAAADLASLEELRDHAGRLGGARCNRPVFDLRGNFLGTPDLLDLATGTAGEYDGALHLAGRQRAKDIRREGVFRRAGMEYVEMVAADLADPADFERRTTDARQRARASTVAASWTITPPPGWVPTHTVALRPALTPGQRERFLGWQAS